MPTYNYLQLKALAQQAGLNDMQSSIAAAIALAESGGNPDANLHTSSENSVGLWQINLYAHPQYSYAQMQDPVQNAQAMVAVSNQGTNWIPWTTYTSGKYQQFLQGTATSGSPTTPPWYTNSYVDNYGSPDPYGGFPKPDINVSVPAGNPITALFSGVVSGVDNPSGGVPPWGHVVTVKLDNAINSIATHTAYLHLSNSTVKIGQQIPAGTVVGYSGGNNPGPGLEQSPVGFALTNGDYYGYGPTWSTSLGSSQLDPTNLWTSITSGNVPLSASTPSFSNPLDAVGNFFGSLGAILPWITNPLRMVKLIVGVLLILTAIIMLVSPEAEKAGVEVAKAAA
jgi:murein DD-endopeptidase MepM/ murein hydrolase activator NlpD